MEGQRPKRSWLFYISPCIIASICVIIVIIESYVTLDTTGGWSALGYIIGMPALAIMLVCDLVIKALIKKPIIIWLIEIVIVAAGVFYILRLGS